MVILFVHSMVNLEKKQTRTAKQFMFVMKEGETKIRDDWTVMISWV